MAPEFGPKFGPKFGLAEGPCLPANSPRTSAQVMTVLYLDIFSGLSGDMFLGALLDLGVDLRQLEIELAKLGSRATTSTPCGRSRPALPA